MQIIPIYDYKQGYKVTKEVNSMLDKYRYLLFFASSLYLHYVRTTVFTRLSFKYRISKQWCGERRVPNAIA